MIDYLKFLNAGMKVIPVTLPDKTPAQVSGFLWGAWRREVSLEEYTRVWENSQATAAAIVCGKLLVIDVDSKNDPDGNIKELFDAALRENLDSWTYDSLVIETSPSGGVHYWFRVPDDMVKIGTNLAVVSYTDDERFKLGYPDERNTGVIIETRGEGQYCLCHPSPGYNEIQKSMFDIVELQADEVDLILQVARSFNRFVDETEIAKAPKMTDGTRPGDYYNRDADPEEIVYLLEKHGWKVLRRMRNKVFFNRPGSGSPRQCHADLCISTRTFICYSTNVTGFVAGSPYRFFSVYTRLEHGGDYRAAAVALKPLADTAKKVEDVAKAEGEVDELLANKFSIHKKPKNTFDFYIHERSGYGVKIYGVGFPGSLITYSGIEKSRKSSTVAAVVASSIRTSLGNTINGTEKFPFAFKTSGKKILWVDTEQSDVWFWENMRRVMVQSGLMEDSDLLVGVPMADFMPAERCLKVDALVDRLKPDILVLDGATDFIWDPNDQKESMAFYLNHVRKWLSAGCMVKAVIHNSKDDTLRGHLGKLLQRKCDAAFVISAEGENAIEIVTKFIRGEKPDAFRLDVGRYNILYSGTVPDYDFEFGLDRSDIPIEPEAAEFKPGVVTRVARMNDEDIPF